MLRTCLGLICLSIVLTGCGKKGALVYPEMLTPAAPSSVAALQTNSAIKLSFSPPGKDRAGRALKDLAGIKVLRRESATGAGAGCTTCLADYFLFRKLYMDLADESARRYDSQMVLLDTDVRPGSDYSYILVGFNADSLDGEPAPAVTVSMLQTPEPPVLTAQAEPTEIRLAFTAPRPVNGGTILGYNVYRVRLGEPMSYLPHNKELLTGNSFVDVGLERRTTYRYTVRTLLRMASGQVLESGASNEVDVQLVEEL